MRDLTNQASNEKNKTTKHSAESISEIMKQINELVDKVDWTS